MLNYQSDKYVRCMVTLPVISSFINIGLYMSILKNLIRNITETNKRIVGYEYPSNYTIYECKTLIKSRFGMQLIKKYDVNGDKRF
jgi:hypothetical protein